MRDIKIIILVMALLLLGIGATIGIKNKEKNKNNGGEIPILAETREIIEETEKKIETVSPFAADLSIEKFSQRTFEGRDFTVGEVLERNGAYIRYFITYSSNGLKISGIMNVPAGTPPTGGFPVLFLNHGYIDPAIYTNGRGLKREQDYLARQGYVVVHSDYRNHAQSDKDSGVEESLRFGYAEDVINGINALKAANFSYVDEERLGMLGHSMGGGVAYLIAVAQPELVDAFVLFAPVSADVRDNFEKWTKSRPEVAEAIIEKYGAPAENPQFWDSVSPITQFEKIAAPILIEHGTADESVPLEWSQKAVAVLKDKGKDADLEVYPGEPHEFTAAWPTVMQRTVRFFDEHIKKLTSSTRS